jgi:ATP-dependent Clp protease ATP-binding subunit ClpA
MNDDGARGGHDAKVSRIGAAAARQKFTPEFINRLDKIVVFKSLGDEELRRVLEIELEMVQERIQAAAASTPFRMTVTESAREALLNEGTDSRYGARHLKRAIERMLVQPLSNLLSSGQIQRGDSIRVSHRDDATSLVFFREAFAREGWKFAAGALVA